MNAHPGELTAPANVEAEAGLLGLMMANASGYPRVSDRLKPGYFYLQAHQEIYRAICDLAQAGKAISPITLKGMLSSSMQVGQMSVAGYLLNLHRDASSIINAVDYADIVREEWAKRAQGDVARRSLDMLAMAKIGGAEACIATQLDELSEIRAALTSDSIPMDLSAAAEAADRVMDGNQGEHEEGVPVPFPSLREVIQDDLMPGQLYGLLAASGEGKTSFILQLMRHAAEQGHPCALMSFDQDARSCINQMASQAVGVEGWRIRKRVAGEANEALLREERAKLAQLPLSVIQCPDAKIEQVLERARAFVEFHNRRTIKAPLIVIDHIMAITDHDPRADAGSKAQHKNRAFRNWAIRHGCAAMMINQRNSSGMRADGNWLPRPTIRDLTGGEAARQDYDVILGMFRPEWWRDEALKNVADSDSRRREKIEGMYGECAEKLEMSLIKARHGNPRMKRTLRFEGVYTRVSEFEQEQPSLIDGGPF